MFGTADEDEDDLNGDTPEPEPLRQRKAELSKREKPRGTTGIPICERITWWQETHRSSQPSPLPSRASLKKVSKKARKRSPSSSSSSSASSPEPVKKPKRKVQRSMSPSGRVVVHDDRNGRSGDVLTRTRSRSRTPPSRHRSRTPPRRSQRSRSRSRSISKSSDDARKPCVFYFSKTATGCRFSARECKFSHDKYDYKDWETRGKELPNQGLIERTRPVRARSRSPRRRY